MSSFDICSSALDSLRSTSLRFRPKTSGPIENGRRIASSFEQSSGSERNRLLETIDSTLGMKLLGLSGFMAEAAVIAEDKSLIPAAILLHIVEDFRTDFRENFRYLILIAHASNEIGVDLRHVIASVGDTASVRARQYLIDFASRNDDLNRLECIGMKAEIADGAFRFSPL